MADTTHLAVVASDMLRQCRQTLRGMENGLSSVMQGRERDFLALGEDLMSLQAGCENIWFFDARRGIDLGDVQAVVN